MEYTLGGIDIETKNCDEKKSVNKNIRSFNTCLIVNYFIPFLTICDVFRHHVENDCSKVLEFFEKWNSEYEYDKKRYEKSNIIAASVCGWYGRSGNESEELLRRVMVNSNECISLDSITLARIVYEARKGKDKQYIYNTYIKYLDNSSVIKKPLVSFYENDDILSLMDQIDSNKDYFDSIILGILCDAYYKYIDTRLLSKFKEGLPKNSGECNPLEVFEDFLEYKAFENVSSEEINCNTYIVSHLYKKKDRTLCDWFYSKSGNSILDYLDIETGCIIRSSGETGFVDTECLNKSLALRNKYNEENGISDRYKLLCGVNSAMQYMSSELHMPNDFFESIFTEKYILRFV